MKGQKHERRDDNIDAEFASWTTKGIALRSGAMTILTVWINEMCFSLPHTLSLQHICWITPILQIFIYIPYEKGI